MIECMPSVCAQSECQRRPSCRGLCSAHYQKARYHGELPENPPTRSCVHCEQSFASRKWSAVYCSKQCNDNARRARERAANGRRAHACEHCGAGLEQKRPHARFCSLRCGQGSRNSQVAKAARAKKLTNRPSCRGCGDDIPPERRGNAIYCSEDCKQRSRRHETYGLTRQGLQALLAQHELCAVCGTDEWGKKGPQVDHCHATGRVRGVLCTSCNTGLGHFRDRVDLLEAAIVYLRR